MSDKTKWNNWFKDTSIISQDSVAVKESNDNLTNGFILDIECPEGSDVVQVILTYEELISALEYLKEDRWVYEKEEL